MNTKKILISIISALAFGSTVALAAGIPENVASVKATAVDTTSIGLTWKAAKDADGGLVKNYRVYYGAVSVLEKGEGDYEKQIDTPNNTPSFVVTGLTSNTKYYFAVTAISSDSKESPEYSLEASATTKAEEAKPAEGGGTADTTAPTVTSVSAPDKQHVKMVFSEAVQLPPVSPEASFGIVEQINPANELTVKSAILDPTDAAKKTILLETSDQKASTNYIVTAGVAIKDLAGNPIVSGSTDSGLFLGSAVEPVKAVAPVAPAAPAASTTPKECADLNDKLDKCEAYKCEFTHPLTGEKLNKEILGLVDNKCHYTEEMPNGGKLDCNYSTSLRAALVQYYKDLDSATSYGTESNIGNGTKNTYTIDGKVVDNPAQQALDTKECVISSGAATKDTTPPENISKLLLSFRKDLEKFVVMMSWTPSLNTAKDLVDQIMYMSMDKGKSYDAGKSLGALVAKTEVANLDGGKEYAFKITTKDASGNESTGVVKSIRLPQTGPALGLLLLGSVGAAKRLLRRKKKDIL
jgi:fibronectin type 3 domain-containing protein